MYFFPLKNNAKGHSNPFWTRCAICEDWIPRFHGRHGFPARAGRHERLRGNLCEAIIHAAACAGDANVTSKGGVTLKEVKRVNASVKKVGAAGVGAGERGGGGGDAMEVVAIGWGC